MRHALECLDGWLDRLCHWLEQVCAVLLALACLVLLVEIVLRALFGHALLWANEFARYAVMWMVMLGSVVLLALAMRSLPLGTAYAIWTGIGAVGAFALGIFMLGEAASPQRLLAAGLIVLGLILMKTAQ